MLDLKELRSDPEAAKQALRRRSEEAAELVDRVLDLDQQRRNLLPEIEGLRARQNETSAQIAQAKKAGADTSELISAMQEVSQRAKELTETLTGVESDLNSALLALPNPPDPKVPDEDAVLREVGDATKSGRDHLELAGDRIDMEAGAKVSGARFAYLKGDLVLLEFALVRWVLGLLKERGFEPVIPPVLVREQALLGTGFLPDTEQQIYRLADDDLYLVGTSEVPLASLHAGEILPIDQLPLRYAAFSTCFRREAGAAGRDTRGIFRVHQFDKVEMFTFVEPSQSQAEHERLLAIEEEILQALELPYRVVNIGVGDLGASTVQKFDLEAWLPGQQRYRELTSTSNTTAFQARRLEIRYRNADNKVEHVHTLNGTAIAIGRTIIALLENGQRDDGSIEIPTVLQKWGAPAVLNT